MWVIMRRGMYLGADPGGTGNTWVTNMRDARFFRSEAEARAEACGNESVQHIF